MKTPAQFRLSDHSIAALNALASEYGVSKTKLVEQAIALLEHELKGGGEENPLLKFAGTISDEEAEQMLDVIYRHRVSKLPLNF